MTINIKKKIILTTLFGIIILLILMQQNIQSSEPLSIDDDFDFVSWSNSLSKEEAGSQLKNFLSSFDNWEQAKAWLIAQGFRVENSLPTPKNTAEIYGMNQNLVLFTAVAGWSYKDKEHDIIFTNNLVLKLEAKLFVHGVSVGFLYSESPFIIHKVNITETRL